MRRRSRRSQSGRKPPADFMLKLLRENRFPRIWVPSPENRLVQMRTRMVNQLQHGVECRSMRLIHEVTVKIRVGRKPSGAWKEKQRRFSISIDALA